MSPPSGVVTFLFTDIEGSTRRWESDAGSMRMALASHDEVLRKAIEAGGGWLFKHTGDGVCAAFASPRSAVDAAVAAQRALELPVRMGIATGEAELRDGDYFGTALNRAARVMAAGHGGQILLAESTASLLSGVDLVDLGSRRLRDVPMPLGVYQARAAGLRTEFPPLRALDSTPGNLRPGTTNLIGRDSEVVEVVAAVHNHRLVTLTGVGGVGKTRLAQEVGARLSDEFPDGVWLFELAAVTDPAAVPDVVASVLGITQQPRKTVSQSVALALEGRVRLLVFDNCEHVLDAAADLIGAILAQSVTVRILATSREGLGIAEERLWRVPSLDVNSGAKSAAVNLFVERAQNVASDFSLAEPDDAAAVVEICRRLDGIPLAIELAASRMASMTVSEIRHRLDHRFRLLVGSRRGLERHQTLRHAVQWSYDHIDEAEKLLLERCSVFAGGFDLHSACSVAGYEDSDYAILDLLDALVRKSLLNAERSAGRTRFWMLETIRQFAEEQLVARGEATHARDAHASHFAGCETEILSWWDSPRQREAYDWFATELANLRSAFRWAADEREVDVAVVIATYAPFLGVAVENLEPIAWAEEIIPAARAVDHPRLAALNVMASLCWMPGRITDAVQYCDNAIGAIRKNPDVDMPFDIDALLGSPYIANGQPDRSVEWYRTQLASGRDPHALNSIGLVLALAASGRSDEAIAVGDGLIDAVEATHNPYAVSLALLAYGYALSERDPRTALDTLRRGVVIARGSGNRTNETHLLASLSRVEAHHGEPLDALSLVTETIPKYHDASNRSNLCSSLSVLALVLDRIQRYVPAATIAGFATNPFTEVTFPELKKLIAHLRDALGDTTYESLARKGKKMTTTAMVTYAYDQIDQARTALEHPG